MEIGVVELASASAAVGAAGWGLLKISFAQFEKKLDDKFRLLDEAVKNVQRMESEILRTEIRYSQLFVTKVDHDKILERIFTLLERMEKKLDGKTDVTDFAACQLRHSGKL